ncbi:MULTISPECIES: MFS transporter [Streptosporangium]|uniref:MFS family permease n=1 Tax=Streptosporangium brasiliense TaxID=47480 RepID=A0ABT9QW47_9ACTN|nr:MFS transporter [Streptosporangium brasiliense]MDP9861107.1 MFS family permease [Streptosporangium brasiliense]
MLVLLCPAQFMVVLDVTVVNVAIADRLDLDRTALTWVITAYTLCFGGLMPLGGRTADAFGRRHVFLAGPAVFTLASLASGPADDATLLVAARAAQGVGATFVTATTTAMAHVDPQDAGTASALISTGHGLGATLGIASVSTIASAGLNTVPAGPASITGSGAGFTAAAVTAVIIAVVAGWLIPAGRPPATDGPVSAH